MGIKNLRYDIIREGISVGIPAIIIEVGKNNNKSMDNIKDFLEDNPCENILITGKEEPLIYSRELVFILNNIKGEFNIGIDTNGGIVPDPNLIKKVIYWNVRPIKESLTDSMHFFTKEKSAYFIFKVSNISKIFEIKDFMKWNNIDPNRVMIQPVSKSKKEFMKTLVTFCKENHVRLGTKLGF